MLWNDLPALWLCHCHCTSSCAHLPASKSHAWAYHVLWGSGEEKGGETDLFLLPHWACVVVPACHALCRHHCHHCGVVIAAQGWEKVRKKTNKKDGGRCTLMRATFSCLLTSCMGAGPHHLCCSHRGYGPSL